MSSILEALERSERERRARRDQMPPAAEKAPEPAGARKPISGLRVPGLVLAVLALGLAALGLLSVRQSAPPPDQGPELHAHQTPSAPASHPPGTPSPPTLPASRSPEAAPPAPEKAGNRPPPLAERTPTGPAAPLPFERLAPELQARIGTFEIQAHVYDPDPAARMIIVNGRVRREGERAGAIEIVRILPDGVQARIDGTDFFVGRLGVRP